MCNEFNIRRLLFMLYKTFIVEKKNYGRVHILHNTVT